MRSCLLLVLIACGGSAPAPATPATPAAPPPVAAPPAAEETGPLDERAPIVRMLVPGTAPRKRMRYQLVAGTIEYLELDMKMSIDTAFDDPTLGARTTKVAIPTIRTTFKSTVTEVSHTGDAPRCSLESESASEPESSQKQRTTKTLCFDPVRRRSRQVRQSDSI